MLPRYDAFIFEDYQWDFPQRKLTLRYSFDEKIQFEETFVFNFDFKLPVPIETLKRATFGLWVMCGISYFKAALPPKIIFKNGGLTDAQKKFFEKTWLHGLGEFFFRNNIDPRGKINFPQTRTQTPTRFEKLTLTGSIVPIGGGKDSIVAAEILKKSGEKFETWSVGHSDLLDQTAKEISVPHLTVSRKIPATLFKLNADGALNGHVPISAILAFSGIITALLRGKQNVVLANEASANVGNTEFHGLKINHQYSKSLEFEKDFQAYIHEFISPEVNYFSILRPLPELKISELFAHHCADKYAGSFSSCNRNFKINPSIGENSKKFLWCCDCPKCAFVFTILAPFMGKSKLVNLFGKNLFTEPNLEKTFDELLGLSGHKPFECVGEIEEVRQAMLLAEKNFPEVSRWTSRFPDPKFDIDKKQPSSMPSEFAKMLNNFIEQ